MFMPCLHERLMVYGTFSREADKKPGIVVRPTEASLQGETGGKRIIKGGQISKVVFICIFDFFVTEQTRRKLIKGLFAILFVCLSFRCLFVGCLVCCLFVLLKHFNDGEVDQV